MEKRKDNKQIGFETKGILDHESHCVTSLKYAIVFKTAKDRKDFINIYMNNREEQSC